MCRGLWELDMGLCPQPGPPGPNLPTLPAEARGHDTQELLQQRPCP